LRDTFRVATKQLEAGEGEAAQVDYRARMRLPASTSPADGKQIWEMGGFRLKTVLRPATVETEASVILSLMEEIRSKLAINLDAAPSLERKVPAVNEARAVNTSKLYLVIGGEHAQNLAEAMRRKGEVADAVVIPGWKASTVGVKILEERLKEAIARRRPNVVIFEVFDDNTYFGMEEDGSTKAATSDDAGKEHVAGRLVVGKKDTMELLFRRMEPIWVATEGINTIIVLPMARYVCKPCCEVGEHITNRMEPDFVATIKGDIREAGGWLKKYLNGTGRSQCQVMDPNVDLAQVESRILWGEDPIYPNAIGYDKMASGVKMIEGKIGTRLGGNKRPRLESGTRERSRRGVVRAATVSRQPTSDTWRGRRLEAGAGPGQELGEEEEEEDVGWPPDRSAGGGEDDFSVVM
jgi:hypothetical protein